jgi:RNA polymerase sigma-70 factor (ECF subfamily)
MDWFQRTRAGDEDAFAAFFEQYKNLVYRTAYLLLDDTHEAEDALQEVFLRVYRSPGSYDPARGAVTTWLYHVTVNHCLNRQRRRRPAPTDPADLDRRNGSGRSSLEKAAERDDLVRHALGGLSEPLHAAVVLRYAWGLPYAEIADVLNVPLGTVKSRLNAALNIMRARLAVEDDIDHTPSPRRADWRGGVR